MGREPAAGEASQELRGRAVWVADGFREPAASEVAAVVGLKAETRRQTGIRAEFG